MCLIKLSYLGCPQFVILCKIRLRVVSYLDMDSSRNLQSHDLTLHKSSRQTQVLGWSSCACAYDYHDHMWRHKATKCSKKTTCHRLQANKCNMETWDWLHSKYNSSELCHIENVLSGKPSSWLFILDISHLTCYKEVNFLRSKESSTDWQTTRSEEMTSVIIITSLLKAWFNDTDQPNV